MGYILPEEAKALDLNAEFLGVSTLQLMENAGRGVVESLKKRMDLKGKRVVILAYSGNKGGDGFVVARHLACLGAHPIVILLARPEQIMSEAARANYLAITKLHHSIAIWITPSSTDLSMLKNEIRSADIIIDAMLGIGLRGKIGEPFKTAIALANLHNCFKVAIDVPTGVDAATGEIYDDAFKANLTVTYHRIKTGLLDKTAKLYAGEIDIIGIGLPPEAEIYCGPGDLKLVVKRKDAYSHKGENGKVLIIGGSSRYSGAPSLAAIAALKMGVDLVTVAVPASIAHEVRTYTPDLIVVPLISRDKLDKTCIPSLKREMENVNTVVIGMGLGLEQDTKDVIKEIIEYMQIKGIPAVIDADAIKALGETKIKPNLSNALLTPHMGEFHALTGEKLVFEREDGWSERLEVVMKWATKLKTTILLKSRYDIITDGERYKIKTIGNPGMTVGGTGDVLAGVAGALLSRGSEPFRAAVAASFLNSYAGDCLAAESGIRFSAYDLANSIPKALKKLGF